MSIAAIKIVEEEIARRRDNQPNIHCAHDMLDTLEARIRDRILKELVEIPEESLTKRYPSIPATELPRCNYCGSTAAYEGWSHKHDPFTGEKLGVNVRTFVCEEHKDQLMGSEKEASA